MPATASESFSRREAIAAAAALAGLVGTGPASAHPARDVDVSRLVRTALFVSDFDRSVAFFRDLLGLNEVFFQGNFTGPVLGRLLGLPAGAQVRACILKAAGPAFGMIGIFHVAGHGRPRIRKQRGTVNVGEAVLVFYAARLDPLVERLRAGGYTIISPPVNLTPRWRELTCYGPDDVMINLIERDPSGQ
ncbi:MAG TPA: VOC family protein [Allosphingosinicella sp.]|nr:VOC family protein [Allosphingosinicella sp.]